MKILIYISILLFSLTSLGHDVNFSAAVSAKNLTTDDQLRLVVKYDKQGEFTPPDLSDFYSSGGHQQSSGSRIVINGQVKVNNMTYQHVYILQPKKAGKLTIGKAKLVVDGKTYYTVPIQIEVGKGTAPTYGPNEFNPNKAVIAKVYASKNEIYEGESITVVYKMYSPFYFSQLLDFELPAVTGFWKTSLTDQKNRSYNVSNEKINGRNYQVVTLQQDLMIAKQHGTIEIEPFKVQAVVQRGWQYVRDKATSNALKINVKPLPAGMPDNFTGAVGKFNIIAEASDHDITDQDDGLDISIKVRGTGNIEFIDDPVIELPNEFEAYPPEKDVSTSVSYKGQSGTKSFNYFIVPLANGDFELGPFEFTYFDPELEQYRTAETDKITISVNKPDLKDKIIADPSKKLEVKSVKELRYIKTNADLQKNPSFLINSPVFWVGMGAPALLFLLLVFFKRRKDNVSDQDIIEQRARRAHKMARSKLQASKKLIDEGRHQDFYEVNLKAMYGYLSEKIGMQVHEMSKQGIRDTLASKGASEETISQYLNIIEDCELGRYGAVDQNCETIYNNSIQSIQSLEKEL